jgi:hypothetical protein
MQVMDSLQARSKFSSKIMRIASGPGDAVPTAWLGGIVVLLALVSGLSSQSRVPSLVHLAGRVERAAMIPEVTRVHLKPLIEQINRDAKIHPHLNDRNQEAAARIERAIFIKPIHPID